MARIHTGRGRRLVVKGRLDRHGGLNKGFGWTE